MPRSGVFPYTYSLPSTYLAVSGAPISSHDNNTTWLDVQTTFNTIQPINYGGTGASTAAGALTNLGLGSGDTPTFAGINVNGAYAGSGTATITGTTAGFTAFSGVSTEAGAAAGPLNELYRNSASPAANDVLGQQKFTGQNSTPAKVTYGYRQSVIASPTAAAEYASLDDYVKVNGSDVLGLSNNGTYLLGNNFVQGYATTPTAAGTTTLTVASKQTQYFTGTTTQTVVLPVTSTLQLGHTFTIYNNSTGKVTIQSSGANTIKVMGGTLITLAPGAPGTKIVCTCISTSGTGTSSWSYEYATPTTDWVTYTPTFTGFGTVSVQFFESRRVGDTLCIRGTFTVGNSTGVEARITMGFNGSNNNVTSDSVKVPQLMEAGSATVSNASASTFYSLIEQSVNYLTFGIQNASTGAIGKQNGNAISTSGITFGVRAEVPLANG